MTRATLGAASRARAFVNLLLFEKVFSIATTTKRSAEISFIPKSKKQMMLLNEKENHTI